MVHNTGRGGKDDISKLTGWEELDNPLLHLSKADVVPGGNTSGLVDTSVELDDDLAGAMVIDLLELANVACSQEVNVRICRDFSSEGERKKKKPMCKDPGNQSFGHLKDRGRREDMTIRLVISPNLVVYGIYLFLLIPARISHPSYPKCKMTPRLAYKKNYTHTMLLHDTQELDNDLGGRSDENLPLPSLLGIVDRV